MERSEQQSLEEIVEAQKKLRAEIVRLDAAIFALKNPFPSPAAIPASDLAAAPEPAKPTEPEPVPPPIPAELLQPAAIAVRKQEKESIELRLGTYWFVRLGIVILLTGLVFLGNYAYKNYFGLLGPGVRLAFFYMAGGALTLLGLWLERGRETLRNYARVLTGGGLAAIYYTTYAAHYVEKLRVIESPLTGGILLLACAGLIAWLAEFKRSQTLAVFAVALALYTSGINRIAGFTLLSNLILACIAMGMLLRHGWKTLAFVSLTGTFGAFALWRFLVLGENPMSGDASWHPRALFLCCYWLIFTAGALWAKPGVLGRHTRVAFATLNNGLAFVLLALTIHSTGKDGFSTLCFLFAALLIGLVFFCRRRPVLRHGLPSAYLAQALFFFTLGILTRFTGANLALILMVESVFLTLAWGRYPNRILRLAALGVAGLATLFSIPALHHDTDRLLCGFIAGLLFAISVGVEKVASGRPNARSWLDGSLYAVLGFFVLAFLSLNIFPERTSPAVFSGLALLLTITYPYVRCIGLLLSGQIALGSAVLAFLTLLVRADSNLWMLAAPPAALAIIGLSGSRQTYSSGRMFHGLAGAYRIGAGFLFSLWVFEFVNPAWRFLCLAVCASLLVLFSHGGGKVRGILVLLFNTIGICICLGHLISDEKLFIGDFLGWLLVLLQGRYFANFTESEKIRTALTVAGLTGIWIHITQWANLSHAEYPLTVCWSLLALIYLGCGFGLRNRVYRLAGFILLTLSLGRILTVDLWQQGTLVRIISVIVTGVVLLILGFIYTKYQDKIRKWL